MGRTWNARSGTRCDIARDIYLDIVANGWDLAMARRQGPRPEKRSNVTIGEYLAIVAAKALVYPSTLESYAVALRKIAADIAGVRHNGSPRSAWRQQVDKRPPHSPHDGSDRKVAGRISSAAARSTRLPNAVRKSQRNRSLRERDRYSDKKVLHRFKGLVELPDPAPFHGIKIGKTRPQRYHADVRRRGAHPSGSPELPAEQLKIFILAAMAGLRRNEIDKLPWTAFRWEQGIIRIEATEYFRPKARESEADVEVDAELLRSFAAIHGQATGPFVIESLVAPDPAAPLKFIVAMSISIALIRMASHARASNSRTATARA